MLGTQNNQPIWRLRTAPKDIGVALVVLVAFGLAAWLMLSREGQTRVFEDAPMRLAYPAGWNSVDSLQDVLLKVEDPQTDAEFKTSFSVERRDLDPASPPTLQTLLDRRVDERSQLTGYHFLADGETEVAGARAIQIEYAYVVQPNDQPRRASLPVVVHAREYIIVTEDRSYYLTLAAPEQEFTQASAELDRIISSLRLQ